MSEPASFAVSEIGTMLGRIPSGVFILTASNGQEKKTGLLASWVQQAGFEPATISVAVNRKRYLHDWLQVAPRLAINQVAEGQKHLLKHFGNGFGPEEQAFEGIPHETLGCGLPVLTEAMGYLAGRVLGKFETGDHFVYFVEIDAGRSRDLTSPWVHLRKSGTHY